MKHMVLSVLNKAVASLKEWTDPAFEGNPYDPRITYAKPVDFKKYFVSGKRMMWRI